MPPPEALDGPFCGLCFLPGGCLLRGPLIGLVCVGLGAGLGDFCSMTNQAIARYTTTGWAQVQAAAGRCQTSRVCGPKGGGGGKQDSMFALLPSDLFAKGKAPRVVLSS